MDKLKQWWKRLTQRQVLTDEEKTQLAESHLEEIKEQVKMDFYHNLDIPCLFEEPITGGLEKIIPWIGVGISAITLLVLLFRK